MTHALPSMLVSRGESAALAGHGSSLGGVPVAGDAPRSIHVGPIITKLTFRYQWQRHRTLARAGGRGD